MYPLRFTRKPLYIVLLVSTLTKFSYDCSGEILEKAENLLSDIEATHDRYPSTISPHHETLILNLRSVKSILDSHRNSIMMLEVHFSVAMVSVAAGTYIAGLYGMNLINGLEESISGFPLTTGVSATVVFIIGLWGLRVIRKVRRVQKSLDFAGRQRRKLAGGKGETDNLTRNKTM